MIHFSVKNFPNVINPGKYYSISYFKKFLYHIFVNLPVPVHYIFELLSISLDPITVNVLFRFCK